MPKSKVVNTGKEPKAKLAYSKRPKQKLRDTGTGFSTSLRGGSSVNRSKTYK